MLRRKSSDSHLLMKSGIDKVLKHRIRNLRAKLKTLLCNQSCTKNSKRQKIVKKIQKLQNQQFYSTNQYFNRTKNIFTHTKQSPKNYWYSQKKQCNIMNIFGKLSSEEIQQIQEDVIYYLGEENVQKFKLFLQIRGVNKQNITSGNNFKRLKTMKSEVESNRSHTAIKNQGSASQRKQDQLPQNLPRFMKNCSIGQRFFNFRNSFQTNDSKNTQKNASCKRLNTANLIQSRTSYMTRKSRQQQQKQRFQANYLGNRQNFLQKRRIIQEQQNAQRIITKINLQMKQQKAIDIFKITQQAFISSIKQKNNMNDSRTRKILENKYKKNVRFGQIVELNEELRKIYIKKISSFNSSGMNS